MKNVLFTLAAIICLLATANHVSAQLIIRNNGHAEIGVNPSLNDSDTTITLKIFGSRGEYAAGASITFGDISTSDPNVLIGENGTSNTDQLWLHGRLGVYITQSNYPDPLDPLPLAFFDPSQSTAFNFNSDVVSHGVLIQSDERFKEDITPIEDVLQSLKGLAPVSYRLKSHKYPTGQSFSENPAEAEMFERYYQELDKGSERYGFLAQNVQDVFPELVHTDMNGYLSVDYIGLIPILVQSINELRAELAELKSEQQEQDADMMLMPSQQTGLNELEASHTSAKLYQNAPNPWSSETVIRYCLPQSVNKADIYIYDMQGKQLMSIPAQGRGENQVTITARNLDAGMYLYALVADSVLVNSKQMILTK